ncbi:MAG: WD40/YVTN/BNR-like repeat-containing protein, partial [Rhodothermaceae bacterium]
MKKIFTGVVLTTLIGISFFLSDGKEIAEKNKRASHPQAAEETKVAREEYFHKILRDPKTDRIPANMRSRELAFYNENEFDFRQLGKTNSIGGFRIKEAGPVDVGGRTRALAVSSDGKYVLAGGVTGGVWKSTDNGESWQLKNTTSQMLSVTCIVQDPRPGKENVWYYGTGEYRGSSGVSGQKYYSGGVIMKSTDHGESWSEVASTVPTSVTGWFSDNITFVSNIKISPVTGSIFVSANGGYLYKAD